MSLHEKNKNKQNSSEKGFGITNTLLPQMSNYSVIVIKFLEIETGE